MRRERTCPSHPGEVKDLDQVAPTVLTAQGQPFLRTAWSVLQLFKSEFDLCFVGLVPMD